LTGCPLRQRCTTSNAGREPGGGSRSTVA
jgi:hypothetical protein